MCGLGLRIPVGENTLKALGAEVASAAVGGQYRDANAGERRIVENVQVVERKSRRYADLTCLVPLGQTPNPRVLPHTSIRIVRAITDRGYAPKLVGGSMIGPQSTVVKTTLGPLRNGFVNYEYWLPVPKMMFAGARELMDAYQARASDERVDVLGYYMAPQAYAQMQVVEQAITATQGLEDDRLAAYTRQATFKTVVGDVAFGGHGEWTESRVLQVQFQNVKDHGVEQFKDTRTQVVVAPSDWASGDLIYPYAGERTG